MDNTLITGDRLAALQRLARQVPKEGYVAELGVYKGGSLAVIAKEFPAQPVLGFDTFEGLPEEQWQESEVHKPKDFNDTSLGAVHNFVCVENDCSNVYLVQGLFPATAKNIKHLQFCFVHVDFDFYLGIKAALKFFWPRMIKGGIIVFDDYGWERCPGVKQALDEFKWAKVITTADYQAAIIKR